MRRLVALLGLAALLATGAPALAQSSLRTLPIPGEADPRVRTLAFKEDVVYSLRGHYGYQMMLEFGEDERIENVSIGDSLAWQVTPNRRADTIFLKPIEFDAATNMSVVTTKRRYTFELTAAEPLGPSDPEILFRVRFIYPEVPKPASTEPAAPPPVVVANAAYSVSGSLKAVPSRVFDDGVRTYFEWPDGAAAPAVFAMAADGSESVVNFTMRGRQMVVERLAPAFALRNGADLTIVHNDGWREPAPGPDAPDVRDPRRRAPTAAPASATSGERRSLRERLFGSGRPRNAP